MRSAGIASGLDVNNIVSQLMGIERVELDNLQRESSVLDFQLSSMSTIKSAISDFQSATEALNGINELNSFKATVGDETQFTATADENLASVGNHSIQITQLAQAHKIASDAMSAKDTDLGVSGTVSISMGGDSFEIDIDSNNDTLEGIRDTINNSLDNTGVQASILAVNNATTGDPEFHLVITSEQTGTANSVTVSDVSGNVASTLNVSNVVNAAEDAEFSVDGYSVVRSSNTVSDVIEGVTLELLQEGGAATSLKIDNDITARDNKIADLAETFVNTFNDVLSLGDQYNIATNTSDSSINLIKTQLRDVVNVATTATGSFSILADLGITTDGVERLTSDDGSEYVSSGKLKFDRTDFTTALTNNFDDAVSLLLDDTEGFVTRFESVVDTMLETGGLLDIKEGIINDQIRFIDNRILREEDRLEQKEEDLFTEFSRLDSIISEFQATGEFLTQQLANLPSTNSNNN